MKDTITLTKKQERNMRTLKARKLTKTEMKMLRRVSRSTMGTTATELKSEMRAFEKLRAAGLLRTVGGFHGVLAVIGDDWQRIAYSLATGEVVEVRVGR